MAGAGTGRMPCSVLTVPLPTLIGEQWIWSIASRSRARQMPTMSQMESTAPTSWKWTFSMSMPWTAASASPRTRKHALGFRLGGMGQVGGVDHFQNAAEMAMFRRVRSQPTRNLVALMPRRWTRSHSMVAPMAKESRAREMASRVGAGVGKRANQHVSGEAGERVDVANRHGYFSLGDGSGCILVKA